LAHLRLRFRTQASKELRGHHFRGALYHALPYARNRSTYLNVTRVIDLCNVPFLYEVQIAGAFEESRRAFAFDDDPKVFRLSQVFEPDFAVKNSFD
jgi:hypothetical protein